MPSRLSALDASFLYLEQPTTPMHVGAVSIFAKHRQAGLDYDGLVELIEQRIALVPRYRQKVRYVPGNLARPVWVDDTDFDIAYHVRRSALPKPGTDGQLNELVARLMSRPLDHTRPLWEMYVVEGLARCVLSHVDDALVVGCPATADDAGALADPLVARVDSVDDLGIGHDPRRSVRADADDAGVTRAARVDDRAGALGLGAGLKGGG